MTLRLAGSLAVAGLLALWPVSLSAIAAENSTQTRVGVLVAPARIDIAIKPDDKTIKQEVAVTNRGTARATFTVSALDLLVHDGIPESLPAGATPYSLAASTTISPRSLTLDPGKTGKVSASFDVAARKPLLGALVVVPIQPTPAAGGSGTGGVGVVTLPRALVVASLAPVEASGELLPSVSLGVDAVRFSLPMLQESGPVVARSTVRDSGTFFERLTADYTFSEFGHPFLTVKGVPSDAMPGGTAQTQASTVQRLQLNGQAVDTAPWACVCQVTVQTYATLANRRTLVPVVQTATVIIFPWRLAGALCGLLALLIVSRFVVRRALHRRP